MKRHNAKLLTLIMTVALATTSLPFAAQAKTNTNTDTKERVIVEFNNKTDENAVLKANGKIRHEYKNVKAIAAEIPASQIAKLKNDPNVKNIEPDVKVQAIGKKTVDTAGKKGSTTTSTQVTDWGVSDVKAPNVWSYGYNGTGVKVAVLDTGIASHPDLTVAGGYSAVAYTTSYADDNGHGTHVAGIIGARNNTYGVVGVAPNVSLYAVKSLDSQGSGYVSDIVEGIDWAINNGMNIINMSLGTTSYSSTLEDAVNTAHADGLIVVAAAGNDGTADTTVDNVEYPAKFANVVAVGAVDQYNNRATFSATGSEVDVAAPGVGIISTYLNGQYAKMDGTSMASPFAAGTLAIMKQQKPTATNDQLVDMLKANSMDLGAVGVDNSYGSGLIQNKISY